jgi:hypothetical protein
MTQPLPSKWFPNLTLRDLQKYKTLLLVLERVLVIQVSYGLEVPLLPVRW